MQQYTLSKALFLWFESKDFQAFKDPNLSKYLKSALKLYVLPGINPKAKSFSSTDFADYSAKLAVNELESALSVFDEQFAAALEAGKTSKETKANYRSALGRFMHWMEKQAWWLEMFPDDLPHSMPKVPEYIPKPILKPRASVHIYTFPEDELPEPVRTDLKSFEVFRRTGGKKQLINGGIARRKNELGRVRPELDILEESSFTNEKEAILRFFGWYVQFSEEVPKKALSLELITQIHLIDEFADWSVEERGNSYSSPITVTTTAIAVAKWLNFDIVKRRKWTDIEIIEELRELRNDYSEKYKVGKKRNEKKKWSHKEITHAEARQVVLYLRQRCALNLSQHSIAKGAKGKLIKGHKRSMVSIFKSWQVYLIVKYLTFCPVRQEEIRNLELGKNLFRRIDSQGNPYYVVEIPPEENKNDLDRNYRLPDILTKDLDTWIFVWRPMADEVVKSQDSWLDFWRYKPGALENLQQHLEDAKNGELHKQAKDQEECITNYTRRLTALQRRIDVLEAVRTNLSKNKSLFIMTGKSQNADAFGKRHNETTIWSMVTYAIAQATTNLFGKPQYINPHAFRHIADKHIRMLGKDPKAFDTLIAHSERMGNEYAEQIMSERDLTDSIVNNWWNENG